MPTCEKPVVQVWHIFVDEHKIHDAMLHWVHWLAPPAGTVKPELQAEQKFVVGQFMQLAILHKMQLPPKDEKVNPVLHCEQKLGVVAQVVQLGTLH